MSNVWESQQTLLPKQIAKKRGAITFGKYFQCKGQFVDYVLTGETLYHRGSGKF